MASPISEAIVTRVSLGPQLADIRLACKTMMETNTLAYFPSTSVTKKKSFKNIVTIKLFKFIIFFFIVSLACFGCPRVEVT